MKSKFDQLISRLSLVGKSYETVLLLIDGGDYESGVTIASRLCEKLSRVIDDIKSESDENKLYMGVVLANRLKGFLPLKKKFEALAHVLAKENAAVDEREVKQDLVELKKYIAVLRREVHLIYPRKNFFQRLSRQQLISISVSAGLLLLVILIGVGIYFHYARKYGLTGEYFSDTDLARKVGTQVDSEINFNWRYDKAPNRKLKTDNYSIRWTGYLLVTREGTYDIFTHSDDGVRLWIDDKIVIDNWTRHNLVVDKSTVTLTLGSHPIRLEYFEKYGQSIIKLFWKHENDARPSIVSRSHLISSSRYVSDVSK